MLVLTTRITYGRKQWPGKKILTAQILLQILDIYECTHYTHARLRERTRKVSTVMRLVGMLRCSPARRRTSYRTPFAGDAKKKAAKSAGSCFRRDCGRCRKNVYSREACLHTLRIPSIIILEPYYYKSTQAFMCIASFKGNHYDSMSVYTCIV